MNDTPGGIPVEMEEEKKREDPYPQKYDHDNGKEYLFQRELYPGDHLCIIYLYQ
jgi:hypothetical protein